MANKKYAKLDQLTTAELESILRADLSDVESDPELIDHVLEVILEREQEESDSSSSDRREPGQDFEKLYKGLNEPLYPYPRADNWSRPRAPLPHQEPSSEGPSYFTRCRRGGCAGRVDLHPCIGRCQPVPAGRPLDHRAVFVPGHGGRIILRGIRGPRSSPGGICRVPGPGRRKGFNTCHPCDSGWV